MSSPARSVEGRGTPPAAPATAWEICTVELWRGYRSSSFFATGSDGAVLFESASFRGGVPQTADGNERAKRAFDGLVALLEADGWTQEGSGPAWFEASFARPLAQERSAVPLLHPEPEPPRAVPDPPPAVTWVEPEPAVVHIPPVATAPPPAPPVERREVAEEPAPPPTLAPVPAPRRRRPDGVIRMISALGAIAGLVLAAVVAQHSFHKTTTVVQTVVRTVTVPSPQHQAVRPHHRQTAPAQPRRTVTTQPQKTTAPAARTQPRQRTASSKRVVPPAAATPTPASPVHLVLIPANSRSSWVELRLRSSSGPLVYKGVVPPSGVQFSGGRIWARFGAAANLTIAVNGHKVPLSGTLEHVFGR